MCNLKEKEFLINKTQTFWSFSGFDYWYQFLIAQSIKVKSVLQPKKQKTLY